MGRALGPRPASPARVLAFPPTQFRRRAPVQGARGGKERGGLHTLWHEELLAWLDTWTKW
jgi:hypothetical protein